MEIPNDNSRFISILSDYGFKVTFGNESNTRFLRKALQALINSSIPIKEVTFVQNEMKGLTIDSRSGIYDIACIDENNNHFIVEMQLGDYPEFIQRMKFYALYRFNTFVKKGKYTFENLSKIYCVGILANTIFPNITDYHNITDLKNQNGELIDDQMVFVTAELDKFKLEESECKSDLEKLIFTMNHLDTITESTPFPKFWDEDWLNFAIKELDTKAMTPEQHLIYEMTISANALAIKNENKKIQEAENRKELTIKTESVKRLLELDILTRTQIANTIGVSEEFVIQLANK